MRIFVSEFLVGGGVGGADLSGSMSREGLAMLSAVVNDISQIANCQVVTTLQEGVQAKLNASVIRVKGPAEEAIAFDQTLQTVDAALMIAPETDGVLASRCRKVVEAGVTSWNCSPAAIELCTDKLRLAEHLQSHGLPTIPTVILDWSQGFETANGPVVLKPRDGAGSTLTFLVRNEHDWTFAADQYRQAGWADRALCQPYIAGRPLSVVANFSLKGVCHGCLPVGEQLLSNDGRFCYLGGTIPAVISSGEWSLIEQTVLAACQTIPGLAGYVGFDLLMTDHGQPLIVEINPRLTTSYVGYRQLVKPLLPTLWLSTDVQASSVPSTGPVEFMVG